MQTEADPASPAGEAPSTAGVEASPSAPPPLDAPAPTADEPPSGPGPAPSADEPPALPPDVGFPPAPFPSPSTIASQAMLDPAVPHLVPAPPRPPAPRPQASIAFLVTVTALSLAADLGTKAWAKTRLQGAHHPHKIGVWKGHVELIFAQNPGGAWSFLRSLPDSLRRPFFLVVSAAAIVFIISIYRRVHRDQTTMKWGLPLALGGAMGNLADRIRYGWVVDFVDVYVTRQGHEHHWPTFNVADIAIVIGVLLMAFDMMRARGRVREEHAPAPGAPTPAV